MLMNLYVIRDRKSGLYIPPFASINDNTAERDFFALMTRPDYQFTKDDQELYSVGSFDSESGVCVTAEAQPRFICQFAEKG